MKPYYEHGGITIFHGRAEEVVPTLGRFDLLLTDPPYGIGMDGHHGGVRSGLGARGKGQQIRKSHQQHAWDSERINPERLLILMNFCDTHIVWGANYFPEAFTASRGWLVWGKGQDGQLNQSDGELAYTNIDSVLRIFTLHRSALWSESPRHPTQKPLALMKWCITQAPAGVQSVLDPFMGSGTTLVAAKAFGMRSVGIDAEEAYCEIAAKRLAQECLF